MGDVFSAISDDREDWYYFEKEHEIVGLQNWSVYSDRVKTARLLLEAFPELKGKIIVDIVSMLISYEQESELKRKKREIELAEWEEYKRLKKKFEGKKPSKKDFDESDA